MPGRAMANEGNRQPNIYYGAPAVRPHRFGGKRHSGGDRCLEAWHRDRRRTLAARRRGRAEETGKTRCVLSEQRKRDSFLSAAELRTVLELRPALRRSFVLRLLAGFSQEDCAELLGCPPERVDRAARTAVRLLPSFEKVNSRGEHMEHQEVDQSKIEQVAYDFWVQRGCPMGSPEEDWFRAEQKLRRETLHRESPVASIAATSAEA